MNTKAIFLLSGIALGNTSHRVKFDLNGNVCPINYLSIPCPMICAPSASACPAKLIPQECEKGSYYCGDGKCHAGPSASFVCSQVKSICSCSGEMSARSYVPCESGMNVSIQFFANEDQRQLVNACQKQIDRGNQSSTSPFVKYCAPEEPVIFSWLSSVFVTFSILVGLEMLVVLYYAHSRKRKSAKIIKSKITNVDSYTNLPTIDQGPPTAPLTFTGYKKDLFGSFVKGLVILSSAGWILLMITLIADYYAVFSIWLIKDSSGMIFDDHDHLSKIFIIFWHFSTLWFLTLQIAKGSLKTAFLVETDINDAEYVSIEKVRSATVKFDDMGRLAEYAQRFEQWLRNSTNTNVNREVKEFEKTNGNKKYVEFECVRYIYNSKILKFEPFQHSLNGTNADLHKYSVGLSHLDSNSRLEMCGPNEILFTKLSFLEGLIKEFSGIFYLYQFAMLEIWYFYAYYHMGVVLTAMIVSSGVVKVLVAAAAQDRILQMVHFKNVSKVLRDGRWTEINISALVVGDCIEIEASKDALSVDCAILNGDVVVDESSLTGEALPVPKFALKNDSTFFTEESSKVHRLYAGTTILETRHEKIGDRVTAVVLATGGSTEKGKLVRDILYPAPFSFVFHEHLKIIFPILVVWGVIMLLLSIAMLKSATIGSWFYGMFGISQVLSPLLPAVLVIGQSVSSERLRSKGIMCLDLNRITLAGKVKVFCFDKTGTLTKDGIEFIGSHEVVKSKNSISFNDVSYDFKFFSSTLQLAMQTCHSISIVQNEHVGNFVDVEMFKNTKASINQKSTLLINTNFSSEPMRVLKRYEFNHSHAYMSVVTQDYVTGQIFVFAKGSFEKIGELVDPASLPVNYYEIAKEHASAGYYVLAVASNKLDTSPAKLVDQSRDYLEAGMSFVGFMLFRNELKSDTSQALRELREAGCRNIMITGDNANTAIFIGKQSGMISADEMGRSPIIYLADFVDGKLQWNDIDSKTPHSQSDVEQYIYAARQGGRKVELAVTGKAFNHLNEYFWIQQFLGDIRIFARMTPLDKVKCVRLHMSNHITAMCGDGGNDAGALKAAHAGIALSGSGSSLVSHFSSSNLSILSCVELLKEARCSLDISLASYKLLIMYGEILAFSGLFQYYFMVQMSQALWIFIDGSTVPLSWALTVGQPAEKLSKTRPTARLLGFETILSVVGQIVINLIILFIAVDVLSKQPFFVCNEFDSRYVDLRKWWEMADNYEGAMLGILTSFQIMHAACAFNIGAKYRQGFLRNKIFIAVYCSMFALLSAVLLSNPNPLGCVFHINCGTTSILNQLGYKVWWDAPSTYSSSIGHNVFPVYFRVVIWFITIFNLVAVLLWEGVFILGPFRDWARIWANGRWQVRKRSLKQ